MNSQTGGDINLVLVVPHQPRVDGGRRAHGSSHSMPSARQWDRRPVPRPGRRWHGEGVPLLLCQDQPHPAGATSPFRGADVPRPPTSVTAESLLSSTPPQKMVLSSFLRVEAGSQVQRVDRVQQARLKKKLNEVGHGKINSFLIYPIQG